MPRSFVAKGRRERAKTLQFEEQLERSRRLEAEAEAALGERGVQVA